MSNQVFQPQRDGSGNAVFAAQYDATTSAVDVVMGEIAADGRADIVELTGSTSAVVCDCCGCCPCCCVGANG